MSRSNPLLERESGATKPLSPGLIARAAGTPWISERGPPSLSGTGSFGISELIEFWVSGATEYFGLRGLGWMF